MSAPPGWVYSDDTDDVVCEICGGRNDVGIRRIMCDDFVCRDCFDVWYGAGIVDRERVREISLRAQGRQIGPNRLI